MAASFNHPTTPRRRPRPDGAFTLVEVLVVFAIIVVLISLTLPGLRQSRESALGAACMTNLHQAGLMTESYGYDHGGGLPPFFYQYSTTSGGSLVVFVEPRDLLESGLSAYQPEVVLACSADESPSLLSVEQIGSGALRTAAISYSANIDPLVRGSRLDLINRPTQVAWLYDGSMGGAGNGLTNIQGTYADTLAFANLAQDTRHLNAMNVLMMDGHVETNTQLTASQIADDHTPWTGTQVTDHDDDGNNGHGNDDDGVDDSNPGQGNGGPNGNDDDDDDNGNGNHGNGNNGNGNGNGNGNNGNGNGNNGNGNGGNRGGGWNWPNWPWWPWG